MSLPTITFNISNKYIIIFHNKNKEVCKILFFDSFSIIFYVLLALFFDGFSIIFSVLLALFFDGFSIICFIGLMIYLRFITDLFGNSILNVFQMYCCPVTHPFLDPSYREPVTDTLVRTTPYKKINVILL